MAKLIQEMFRQVADNLESATKLDVRKEKQVGNSEKCRQTVRNSQKKNVERTCEKLNELNLDGILNVRAKLLQNRETNSITRSLGISCNGSNIHVPISKLSTPKNGSKEKSKLVDCKKKSNMCRSSYSQDAVLPPISKLKYFSQPDPNFNVWDVQEVKGCKEKVNELKNKALESTSKQDWELVTKAKRKLKNAVKTAKLQHKLKNEPAAQCMMPHYCDFCDRGFNSVEEYKHHCEEHVKCKFNGCHVIGQPKVIQLHYKLKTYRSTFPRRPSCSSSSESPRPSSELEDSTEKDLLQFQLVKEAQTGTELLPDSFYLNLRNPFQNRS
ncbi:hypothetical protein GQR58_002858 [Nymphon striatum]|nr:hypothetical protein GQR58_002858 [Nymphon striatum]